MSPLIRKGIFAAALLLGIFLSLRYLLPLVFPFLLGGALACAAEPIVRFGCDRLRLPRPLAVVIGISLSLSLLIVVILILAALLIRELSLLSGVLPALADSIRSGMDSLSAWLLALAQRAPEGISGMLSRQIRDFFSGSSALLDQALSYALRFASGFLKQVPSRAVSFGTGIIASFMISAKLPKLKQMLRVRLDTRKLQPLLCSFRTLKGTLGGWLKAQAKLSLTTCLIATAGLFLLHVPHAPVWGVLIALVDAFPVLGTGAVLIPWSLVSFLQGDRLLAFGLLGLYAAAAVTRTVLEPRLVGKHLGLDPLVTLMALYAGFKLFGLPGMLLAPMMAVTVTQLMELKTDG